MKSGRMKKGGALAMDLTMGPAMSVPGSANNTGIVRKTLSELNDTTLNTYVFSSFST